MPKLSKWKPLQNTEFQVQKLNEMENAYDPLISTARNELASGGERKAKTSKSCAVQGFCNDFVALFPRLCFQFLYNQAGKAVLENHSEKEISFSCSTT